MECSFRNRYIHSKYCQIYFAIITVAFATMLVPGLSSYSALLSIIMLCALFAVFYNRRNVLYGNEKRCIIYSVIYISMIIVYRIIGVSDTQLGYIGYYVGFVIVVITSVYIPIILDRKLKILLFKIIFVVSLLSIAVLCITNRNALDVADIADTPYCTMVMFYMGACFVWFLHAKKTSHKIISILAVAISMYSIVFVFQRGINTILGLVMLVLLLLFNTNRSSLTTIIVIFFSVLLFWLYFSGTYVDVLLMVGKLSGSPRIQDRMNQIISIIYYADAEKAGGTFTGRYRLIELSIETWKSHFFFGAGDHRLSNSIIGNHSELIDTLAKFGVIGGFDTVLLLKNLFSVLVKNNDCQNTNSIKRQIIVMFSVFIARGFLGFTFRAHIALQLLIFLPLVIELYCNDVE